MTKTRRTCRLPLTKKTVSHAPSTAYCHAFFQYLEGKASPADIALIEAAVRKDPALRREAATFMASDRMLRQLAREPK